MTNGAGWLLRSGDSTPTLNRSSVVSVCPIVRADRRIAIPALLLAAALLGVVGCSSGTTPPPLAASSGAGASAAGPSPAAGFRISGYAFPALTATPGQTITIADADGEPHSVTADDGSFDSGSFDSMASGTLVAPTKPGTYPVHCSVHPSMHGTLTVH